MDIIGNIQTSLNKGMTNAGRVTETVKLKARLSQVASRRQGLAAQLGASLYEATRNVAEFREGREALYDGIASCDAERDRCQAEIERLEHEAAAAQGLTCPFCGTRISVGDLFCMGCGKPMSEVKARVTEQQAMPQGQSQQTSFQGSSPKCPGCGATVQEGDVFCMSCGCDLRQAAAASATAPSLRAENNPVGTGVYDAPLD